MKNSRVSIVIPAYNEADTIVPTLRRLQDSDLHLRPAWIFLGKQMLVVSRQVTLR